MSVLFAETSVDGVLPSFDKTYAYRLNENDNDIKPGTRVLVPFGASNKPKMAIVTAVTDKSPTTKGRIKSVMRAVDSNPVLTQEMLDLAFWIKDRTFCTVYEAVKAMLPAGINYKTTITYSLNTEIVYDSESLNNDEKLIVEYLKSRKNSASEFEKICKDCGVSHESKAFATLREKDIILRNFDAARRIGDNMQKMVRFVDSDSDKNLSQKQKAVCDLLKESGTASVKEICYFTGVTPAVITALVNKGFAEFFEREVYRTPFEADDGIMSEILLSEKQNSAFVGLKNLLEEDKSAVSLLYGVTGSGKTQVFLKLIDEAVKNGKDVIVMVPEISLTPQTIKIFKKRYGKKIAVIHSGLSMGERVDEYKRLKNKEATIAIGTRSAVFAPLDNIGLIIMDEEQEHTYKSESNPRFHARDVAKFRCVNNNALLVLASATPSVESYANAKNGRYHLFTLDERYGNAVLPQVVTVDLNNSVNHGEKTVISPRLAEELENNFKNGHQSIILLNRRGYNTFVACKKCNEPITCPNCSISMTYHSANGKMMCHYCGHSTDTKIVCPSCGSEEIRFNGVGTQKIEQELQFLLPDAKILRMDADSTMSRLAYEENFSKFAEGKYDIMIGTQMVAKGLDFENVTLVGIICADMQLYNDDYKSGERTFSLLTQVIGRSGRGNFDGKAVIQTFNPENEIIKFAEKQDYDSFYDFEIKIRKMMVYPPYCDICVVGFVGEKEADVAQSSRYFLELLKTKTSEVYKSEQIIVLGPVPLKVAKVSNKFRYRLILKCHNTKSFRAMISQIMEEFDEKYKKSDVTVYADINPETLI